MTQNRDLATWHQINADYLNCARKFKLETTRFEDERVSAPWFVLATDDEYERCFPSRRDKRTALLLIASLTLTLITALTLFSPPPPDYQTPLYGFGKDKK